MEWFSFSSSEWKKIQKEFKEKWKKCPLLQFIQLLPSLMKPRYKMITTIFRCKKPIAVPVTVVTASVVQHEKPPTKATRLIKLQIYRKIKFELIFNSTSFTAHRSSFIVLHVISKQLLFVSHHFQKCKKKKSIFVYSQSGFFFFYIVLDCKLQVYTVNWSI